MNAQPFVQTEFQETFEAQLLSLGKNVAKNLFRIEDIGDYIPGSVMVQDLGANKNTYMNQFGCDYLRHSSEELQEMGVEYFDRFFPKEEISILKPELMKFVMQGDENKVYSFFQRVRSDTNSDYKWYFTTSKLYPADIPGHALKLVHIAVPADMCNIAGKKFTDLIEDDAFLRKNYRRFNLLSVREKEIIHLIVEGKSSFEIADQLFLSIHTINNHRKNILRKLEINSLSLLIKFAIAFNIV
ncbi:transcriptional regulator, LuxR family protein [Arcticibacter svalbardensis MN12-7]|uniref:Transcriptional regulator, LuxR family protein n=1 Tax=Arcticibacter svalbardensis MN12-7 TaxID=1150600 RepID=R9GMZ9_9SPHI|nr:helix-turn-helix transcriptional regulator [Arcticibacter svalbardensis]EOR92920.1 transcriptional regulator, LuxR family protein [Arcticibacter svalbardensis MN12-7]